MQLQGFLFMIFTFLVLPIFVLFSNHNVFFVVIAIILLIGALRSVRLFLFGQKKESPQLSEEDLEFIEEIEDSSEFDFKRFDLGLEIAKYCILILFYFYCSFYINNLLANILIAALIAHCIYHIIDIARRNKIIRLAFSKNKYQRIISAITNFITAILIIITAYNKLK